MLDTLGSFIIGGIVLMLMTIVVVNLQDSARDTMFNEISQISLAEMSQTMERELTNLGYRVSGPQKIVSMTSQAIKFLTDYDNNGIVDTIAYVMRRTTAGPVVTRTISSPGRTPMAWTTRGTMVLFTGYDQNGTATFDAAQIRAVEASMLTSNVLYDKLNGTSTTSEGTTGITTVVNHTQLLNAAVDCTAGAYWHKTIYPKNLTVEAPHFAEEIVAPLNNGTTDPGTTDPVTQ